MSAQYSLNLNLTGRQITHLINALVNYKVENQKNAHKKEEIVDLMTIVDNAVRMMRQN